MVRSTEEERVYGETRSGAIQGLGGDCPCNCGSVIHNCIDLECDADRAKLSEPESYLAQHEDELVILDEIQRTPQLFQNLRGLIDSGRRRGRGKGRFLVLGSIEALIAAAPDGTEAHFFRTAAGAEIDLLLKLPDRRKPWAIEIKRGLAPKIERGFHLACDTIRPERRLVVYGGVERFPLAEAVEAVSLGDLSEELSAG